MKMPFFRAKWFSLILILVLASIWILIYIQSNKNDINIKHSRSPVREKTHVIKEDVDTLKLNYINPFFTLKNNDRRKKLADQNIKIKKPFVQKPLVIVKGVFKNDSKKSILIEIGNSIFWMNKNDTLMGLKFMNIDTDSIGFKFQNRMFYYSIF